MLARRLILLLAALLAAALGGVLLLQRQSVALLREEIRILNQERTELVRLKVENARLAASLPPDETLSAWRADQAAVVRLRREIEQLKASVETRERALAAGR